MPTRDSDIEDEVAGYQARMSQLARILYRHTGRALDTLKADLRDMEGAAIAHVALRAGVRCRMVKSVSDVAGSGSTTDQYLANLKVALASLSAAIPAFYKG